MLQRFQRRHTQRFQRLDLRLEHRIFRHAIGMKLLEEPLLQTDLFHALHVAGPRAEGQAIQRVQDLYVLWELLLEELAVVRRLRRLGLRQGRKNEDNAAEGMGQESTAGFHEPITIKRHSSSEVYGEVY